MAQAAAIKIIANTAYNNKPRIFLALLQTPWMCSDHDRSEDIKIPSYIKVGTTSKVIPLSESGRGGGYLYLFLEMCMVLHGDIESDVVLHSPIT